MLKKKSGSIPERIVYIDRQLEEHRREFDDGTIIGKPVIAPKSFVADATNEKTIKTGERWATGRSYWSSERVYMTPEEVLNYKEPYGVYQDKDGRWFRMEHNPLREPLEHTPVKTEEENVPFAGVRILSLEHRSEGGRAYKVLAKNRVFDLREDVLLDVLLNCRIENQKIDASFIWCRVGSEMKMVRVGSELHKAMIKSVEIASEMKTQELVYGGIYETKTKTLIYLGQHRSIDYDTQETWKQGRWGRERDYKYTPKEVEPLHVFYQIGIASDLELFKLGNFTRMFYFYLRLQKSKPKSVFKGTIDLPPFEEVRKQIIHNYFAESNNRHKKSDMHASYPYSQLLTVGYSLEEFGKMLEEKKQELYGREERTETEA